jgi:hypothetical protein
VSALNGSVPFKISSQSGTPSPSESRLLGGIPPAASTPSFTPLPLLFEFKGSVPSRYACHPISPPPVASVASNVLTATVRLVLTGTWVVPPVLSSSPLPDPKVHTPPAGRIKIECVPPLAIATGAMTLEPQERERNGSDGGTNVRHGYSPIGVHTPIVGASVNRASRSSWNDTQTCRLGGVRCRARVAPGAKQVIDEGFG